MVRNWAEHELRMVMAESDPLSAADVPSGIGRMGGRVPMRVSRAVPMQAVDHAAVDQALADYENGTLTIESRAPARVYIGNIYITSHTNTRNIKDLYLTGSLYTARLVSKIKISIFYKANSEFKLATENINTFGPTSIKGYGRLFKSLSADGGNRSGGRLSESSRPWMEGYVALIPVGESVESVGREPAPADGGFVPTVLERTHLRRVLIHTFGLGKPLGSYVRKSMPTPGRSNGVPRHVAEELAVRRLGAMVSQFVGILAERCA